jgi:hypothetical protein
MAVNNAFLEGRLPFQDNLIGFTSSGADRIEELLAERQGQGLGSLVPTVPTLRDAFEDRREQYRGILGDSEEQKRQTQAQILFDLANTALAFSTPGSRAGMSPAERLAEAAVQTKLFPTIGARAQAAQEQKQKVDLAALQSAEQRITAAETARAKAQQKLLESRINRKTTNIDGQVIDITDPKNPFVIFGDKNQKTTTIDGQLIDYTDSDNPKVLFGKKKPDTVTVEGQIVDISDPKNPTVLFGTKNRKTTTIDGQLIDYTDSDNPKVLFGTKKAELKTVNGQIIDISDLDNPKVLFGDKERKLQTVQGQVVDVTDTEKPFVVFGRQDKDIRSLNGELIDITDPKNPVVVFGKPDTKTITLDGQVLDVTDPNNVRVIFGDQNKKLKVVKGQIVDVTNPDQPLVLFGERTPEKGTFQNLLLNTGEMTLVKKVGNTLYDRNGNVIDLSTEKYDESIIVSKDKAFEVQKTAKRQQKAGARLTELLDEENIGLGIQNLQISEENPLTFDSDRPIENPQQAQAITFDAVRAARKGIGFGPRFGEIASRVLGNLSVSFEDIFAEEIESRNFLNALGTLFRVAFAASPRLAEAEQARLATLFPDTSRFIDNPKDAIRKLVLLKKLAKNELIANTRILKESSDATLVREAERQSYALEEILNMLQTVPETGFTSETEFQDTFNTLLNRRQNRNAVR